MAENASKETVKKSPKKLILIIALVLLLLGAGVAGYYFFVMQPGAADHSQESGDKTSNKENTKPEQEVPAVYYDLAAPLVVNFPPGSSAKIIKVSLSILVEDEASANVLKKHEPMIRNNLLMAISSIGADKAKTIEGKQELQAIMLAEIGKVMNKMTGKNSAKEVYFTEFVMQ